MDKTNVIIDRHTEIFKETISVNDLNLLEKNEEIIINHPLIENLQISLRYDCFADDNLPVVFYSTEIKIRDNVDPVFPEHNVNLNNNEIIEYLEELFSIPDMSTYNYFKSLRRKGLKEGDIILLEDGQKGIIIVPAGEELGSNIRYVPLKKDGTKSKVKPRYLYAKTNYTVLP